MPTLTIDGREVQVENGATLLDAARKLGIDIPTLCYLEGYPPSSSCLVCVVKIVGPGRLVPSCATRAEEGMCIESETAEVHEARKTALELLLSDHVGDCLAPCHAICPLDINIPRVLREIEAEDLEAAVATLRDASPMPAVQGRICPANCESGCRRSKGDGAVSIRNLERHVGDRFLAGKVAYTPPCLADTGKHVAVIGAGPAGLSAALFLRRLGHACTLVERSAVAGGQLRGPDLAGDLPASVLDAEIAEIRNLGVAFRFETDVADGAALKALTAEFDAVLIATGPLTSSETWGLPAGKTGLTVQAGTFATKQAGVFAAGDVVRARALPVRALADGKAAALAIDQFLTGQTLAARNRAFTCRMGKLTEEELGTFVQLSSMLPRSGPPTGEQADFPALQARREAERCLHCDCRVVDTCMLKGYAEQYGASPSRFKGTRREFVQLVDHPHVIFEPAKCIQCGICVLIARDEKEALGLTYIGRGFDVRIGVPLDGSMADALRDTADRVVAHCPTGALAARKNAPKAEETAGD